MNKIWFGLVVWAVVLLLFGFVGALGWLELSVYHECRDASHSWWYCAWLATK